MRGGVILAAALGALSATSAHAEDWCGYAAHANATIECGYSTAAECESAIGKGAHVLRRSRLCAQFQTATPVIAAKRPAGRG